MQTKTKAWTDDGATPLYTAALKGHLEVVRFLVESGANKDQGTTDKGATPLFVAAEKGHLAVVRLLVESGANTDQGTTGKGATPSIRKQLRKGVLKLFASCLSQVPTKTKARLIREQHLST